MALVFVVFPVLLAISTFFKINYEEDIILFSYEYFNNVYFGFQLLSLFQYGVFAVMFIVYPIYPALFSIEKFFTNREPQNSAIIEYEVLKNLVYVLSPFFIFAILYLIAVRTEENPLTVIVNVIFLLLPPHYLKLSY